MAATIAMIGTGYVGLTSGACLAHLGHRVICVDVDAEKIDALNRGEMPILEAGLEDLVAEGRESGRLTFVLGAQAAITQSEFVYLCVPTPQGDDGSADLSYIEAAAREIGPLLAPGSVVINKSTVPVGSTRVVERAVRRNDVYVVSNPEFLREGSAVGDFMHPDRVVIGSDNKDAAIRVAKLYEPLQAPVMITDPASAETIKYAANAFLATKLSYINAVAAVCEAVGADVNDVVLGMGYDTRIGKEFLVPGPGWGGSCFPKDTLALIRIAEDAGYDFGLLRGVVEVNIQQFERVVDKVAAAVGGDIAGKRVAAWGITFKANTDDTRESPALKVLARLNELGAEITAFDPAISADIEGISVAPDAIAACKDADVLLVLTEWDEFKWVEVADVRKAMSHASVVDARNLLDRQLFVKAGFEFSSIGRA